MKIVLAAFIIFEIVLIIIFGITVKTITLTMGPGLIIVFGYALYYFVYTVKRSFVHNKFISKAMIASAFTFAYGCFIITLPDALCFCITGYNYPQSFPYLLFHNNNLLWYFVCRSLFRKQKEKKIGRTIDHP